MNPCHVCDSTEPAMGVEYRWPCRERYDGISEWVCTCGTRLGRWSGRVLADDEIERRHGGEPVKRAGEAGE